MAAPTLAQLSNPNSSANGLTQQSEKARGLACLAMAVSGQNPDGTPGGFPVRRI